MAYNGLTCHDLFLVKYLKLHVAQHSTVSTCNYLFGAVELLHCSVLMILLHLF